MKSFCRCGLVLAGIVAGCTASALDVEFFADEWRTNGVKAGVYSSSVPEGWFSAEGAGNKIIYPFINTDRGGVDKVPALKLNFYSASKGSVGELKMGSDLRVPGEEIVCDNVVVTLSIYLQKAWKVVDTVQVLATTNNWAEGSVFEIGGAVPIRDDSYDPGWSQVVVKGNVPGISQYSDDVDLKIGIIGVAGGMSSTYGYLHGMKIEFKAYATPEAPVIVDVNTNSFSAVVDPGVERGLMSAAVEISPVDKVYALSVTGVLSRCNGERTTVISNELVYSEIDGRYYERVEDAARRAPFDAGEEISFYAFTKYRSTVDPFGEIEVVDKITNAYEYSESAEYGVAKSGSVWVNELWSDGEGGAFVELCGTTNRAYMAGWKVVLTGVTEAEATCVYETTLVDPFDFTTNMNNGVVGFETHRIDWDGTVLTNVTLELKNSAGVTEFRETGLDFPAHYQMNGRAKWRGADRDDWSYDWSGTATNGTFSFELTGAAVTAGAVNEGQGFIVPVGNVVYVTAQIDGTEQTLPYASVLVTADGILNGEAGTTNFTGSTEAVSGTAAIAIEGFSDDASKVRIEVEMAAFGWKAEATETEISLYENVTLTNAVSAALAYDDFSTLNAYWGKYTTIINSFREDVEWQSAEVKIGEDSERVLQLDTRTGSKGEAYLTSCSYVDLRGKRCLDVSLDFRNEVNRTQASALLERADVTVCVADTADFSGTVVETLALPTKSSEYDKEEWYSVRQFIEIPADFAADGKIWIRVKCRKLWGATSVYATLDNLRVASQDAVKVNSLKVADLPAPEQVSGYPVEFPEPVKLDITPLTGGLVSNYVGEVLVSVDTNYVRAVSADLMVTINGNEFAVPFSFNQEDFADAVTNDVSAAMTNVVLTIDPAVVTAVTGGFLPGDEVEYYARVSYLPEDADEAGGRDFRYYPDNATITNLGWYVKGGYRPAAKEFSVEGPALCIAGATNVTDRGISFNLHGFDSDGVGDLVVRLAGNGVDETYHPFAEETPDSPVRVNGAFTVADLLAPDVAYAITIAATNSNGVAMQPEISFEFVTRPELRSAVITGTGADSVALVADGVASGYAVVEPEWTQTGAASWTRAGGTPNCEMTATVYATNRVGMASETNIAAVGYTMAAVATRAPVIYVPEGLADCEVRIWAADDYAAADDGNPDDTEYAVVVTTSSGLTNLVEVWKKLADWQGEDNAEILKVPSLDLMATNDFSFVTRNFDGLVTTNAAPVSTNCWFDMGTGIAEVEQQSEPFGVVTFSLNLLDPLFKMTDGEAELAEVEYTLDGGANWLPLISFNVTFEAMRVITNLEWNAWAAVEETSGEYTYRLRSKLTKRIGFEDERTSDWTETDELPLDFAPPANLAISGEPVDGSAVANLDYDFAFSAEDTNDMFYEWTLDGVIGTNATKSGSVAEDGVHALSVRAIDAMGNASQPVGLSWRADTIAPSNLVLTASPADGEFTTSVEFSFSVSAEDYPGAAIVYHWATNGFAVAGVLADEFAGTVSEGTNTVSVYAEDAVGNCCEVTNSTWVVDLTKPTKPEISGMPVAESIINKDAIALAAEAKDVNPITYYWTLNGSQPSTDSPVVTAYEGTNTVAVYAVDAAGNVSETNSIWWVYDKTAPTEPAVSGNPSAKEVTSEAGVALAAASDDKTAVTYHWKFNGADSVGEALNETSIEGTNTVSVYAVDAAGNVSTTNSFWWVLDTVDPTEPVIAGDPKNDVITNGVDYAFSAASEDATILTYRWTIDDGAKWITGAEFAGSLTADGVYTVKVYATDEAGNVSKTNSLTWTCDTISPTEPVVTGDPENGVVTNGVAYAFSATSEDATAITYRWTIDDGASWQAGADFAGELTADGVYTVKVYATDAAGNVSTTNSLTWTCDTTNPTEPVITGAPAGGEITNGVVYAFSASSEDATKIVYSWTLDNGKTWTDGEDFAGSLADDGVYTVKVYATDEAGNVSKTNELSWTCDTTNPTEPVVTGDPEDGVVTNGVTYAFSAASEDATMVVYRWTIDDGESWAEGAEFAGELTADGVYTVKVFATDAAGNVSKTNSLTWTCDTTNPTKPVIAGDPKNGVITNGLTYAFSAASEDATAITYRWTIDDGASWQAGAEFAGELTADGVYTVKVYATDAAGNVSMTNETRWVLDTVKPELGAITGTPADKEVTKDDAVALAITAEDKTEVVFHWIFNEGAEVFGATLNETSIESTNTVSVYAVDAAGNVSLTNSIWWVRDTTKPTKPVISGTPADKSFTNAKAYQLAAAANDATELTFYWTQGENTGTGAEFSGEVTDDGVYSASVYAIDAAGNVSETNSISWTLDTIKPTSPEISGSPADGAVVNTPGYLFVARSEDANKIVYHWTLGDTLSTAAKFSGELSADGVYTVSVYVTDAAGNVSETNRWTWTYDTVCPSAKVTSEMWDPFSYADLSADGDFLVKVEFSEPATNFTAESVQVVNGLVNGVEDVDGKHVVYNVRVAPVTDGEVSVKIAADQVADYAGNLNLESDTLALVYDDTPPSDVVIVEARPGNGEATASREYEITVEATDAVGVLGFIWEVNGQIFDTPADIVEGAYRATLSGASEEGMNSVRVYAYDVWSTSENDVELGWLVTDDVIFGGGVTFDPSAGENTLEITAVDFRPGEDSTVTMSGFDAITETGAISGLQMRLMVSETLDGVLKGVNVKSEAVYDLESGELTVTFPAVESDSLFIHGVDKLKN